MVGDITSALFASWPMTNDFRCRRFLGSTYIIKVALYLSTKMYPSRSTEYMIDVSNICEPIKNIYIHIQTVVISCYQGSTFYLEQASFCWSHKLGQETMRLVSMLKKQLTPNLRKSSASWGQLHCQSGNQSRHIAGISLSIIQQRLYIGWKCSGIIVTKISSRCIHNYIELK